MLFSIVTVCYNSEKSIERTIKSILNQTEKDYEYIIVDGKSTDKTLDIVKKYEESFEGKLVYISEKDKGIYDAMNKGISMSKGQLIGILNSDDFYEKDALQNMKEKYNTLNENEKKHVVFYGFQRIVKDGKEIAREIYHHDNLDNQMITHPTCFVSRDTYKDFGLFDTNYKSASDYDFMMRLYHKTDTLFVPIYEVISNFERGGISGTGVGQIEAAKIRYKYGIVPRSRIWYEKFHSSIVKIYRKIK